jgi:hypothetical protein
MASDTKFVLGAEIISLIQKHYPYALRGDAEQLANASVVLAQSLGGLLAFVNNKHGSDAAVQAINIMVDKIVDNAFAIDVRAKEIVRTGVKKAVGH